MGRSVADGEGDGDGVEDACALGLAVAVAVDEGLVVGSAVAIISGAAVVAISGAAMTVAGAVARLEIAVSEERVAPIVVQACKRSITAAKTSEAGQRANGR